MNRITENIPDEAEIADVLEEMRRETGDASIVQWALLNNADALKEWAFYKEDGSLDGPLALDFAQAIRIEGSRRSVSKHASGVVICSEPVADVCPMFFDKGSKQMMTALDHRDSEKLGLTKFDILGLRTLSCLAVAERVVRTGRA